MHYMRAWCLWRPEEGILFLRTRVTNYSELLHVCVRACVRSCVHAFIRVVRELYLGPLKEQLMLLNSELFFQPPPTFCF